MSAVFDSIDIARLVEYSLDRDFPCWVHNLSLQVHTASRAFKEGPYVSHFIRPTGNSILAGCRRSIQFTRNALYNTLDEMHRQYRPCSITTFVDDLAQTFTGPLEVVRESAIVQGRHLVELLRSEGFAIAPKSTLCASSISLGLEIQQGLAAAGIHVQNASGARDVGVDFAAGARRRITLQRNRLVKVRSGIKAVI